MMKAVKTDLNLLIEYLEAEKKALKRITKSAAAEYDNLIVYYNSEALLEIERRLDVLKCFKDPHYERKKELRRRIDTMKNMPFNEFSERIRDHMKKLYDKKTSELETDLQKLIENPAKIYDSTHIIDSALFSLYERRCKSFKLLIREEEGFGLHFKLKKSALIITLIGDIWDNEPDFVIDNRTSKKLEGLGFQIDEPQNKYFRTFDLTGFRDANPIKQWLAGFIVDFCRMYGSGKNIHLVYR